MAEVNIVNIYKSIADKEKKKKETYQRLLKYCERVINLAVKKDVMQCIYKVPEFKFGLPIYDLNACI